MYTATTLSLSGSPPHTASSSCSLVSTWRGWRRKVLEQSELRPGQRQRPFSTPGAATRRFEDEVGEAQVVRGRGAAKQGAHAREQLLVGKWFDQVVVGAAVEAPHPLLGAAERGEDQDGKLPCRPQPPAHADAVEAWQHQIENHEVRRARTSSPEGINSVSREHHTVALA